MSLLEFLQMVTVQHALVAGVLVAVSAGLIGSFVVLRGMSLLGDSLAHASFSGLALGLLLGLAPFPFALLSAAVAGLAIHTLEHRGIVRGDTAIGIIFAGGLGVGIVLATLGGGFDESLLEAFFGSIQKVTGGDLLMLGGLLGVLLLAIVGFYKEYVYLTFDEETAEASGLPTHALNVLFVVLTAVAVVAAVKIVGVLLVSSLLILPAAASQHVSSSFRRSVVLAVVFAVTATLLGILLAFLLGWPPGGAVVSVSLALFAAAVLGMRVWQGVPGAA
ncbi:MAG: metal ABC transporter permease [Thermoplasmata archaeon]